MELVFIRLLLRNLKCKLIKYGMKKLHGTGARVNARCLALLVEPSSPACGE